jgi:hypothetical protein
VLSFVTVLGLVLAAGAARADEPPRTWIAPTGLLEVDLRVHPSFADEGETGFQLPRMRIGVWSNPDRSPRNYRRFLGAERNRHRFGIFDRAGKLSDHDDLADVS